MTGIGDRPRKEQHPNRVVSRERFAGPLWQQDAYRAPYHDELRAAEIDAQNHAPWPDDDYDRDDYDYDDGGD